jgi:hypothetical protein
MKSKTVAITGLVAIALAGITFIAFAHGNEEGSAKATIGTAKVSIDFRRPMLKGRDLMKLIHPGDLWRMGADVPTTIDSDTDLDFGGTRIAKGKHILLARFVEPGKWTLVVSAKDRSHYEPSAKLAEIPMQVEEVKDSVDAMNIQLSNSNGAGNIEIAWGTFRLRVTFAPAT